MTEKAHTKTSPTGHVWYFPEIEDGCVLCGLLQMNFWDALREEEELIGRPLIKEPGFAWVPLGNSSL